MVGLSIQLVRIDSTCVRILKRVSAPPYAAPTNIILALDELLVNDHLLRLRLLEGCWWVIWRRATLNADLAALVLTVDPQVRLIVMVMLRGGHRWGEGGLLLGPVNER